MIVVDSSAWVEFFRGTDHPVVTTLLHLIDADADLAITEVILMELLAGVRSDIEMRSTRSHLLAFPVLVLNGLADFEDAASVYRTCRRSGETIRSLSDCLIAVAALREGASILHNHSDFDAIARHTELRIEPPITRQ